MPERIESLAHLIGVSVSELIRDESLQAGPLKYQLNRVTSNRRSQSELEALLFSIEDYVALKEQLK